MKYFLQICIISIETAMQTLEKNCNKYNCAIKVRTTEIRSPNLQYPFPCKHVASFTKQYTMMQ